MLTNSVLSFVVTCVVLAGSGTSRAAPASELRDEAVYLFTSFRGHGDGLHLAWSEDARRWTDLGHVFLKPEVGAKLMRDPHILRGPDGLFHMVWTSGWSDKGIGYAWSSNLVNWSEQRYLPLMETTPGTKTCWAPEVYYEARLGHYLIVWSSNVETPGVRPPKGGFHRAYYVLTRDFATFTAPKILFDPGFNNIDTTMLQVDGKYVIVFKETDDQPAGIWGVIHGATADGPLGPYTLLPEAIIKNERVEGPALASVGGTSLLYVDYYVNHRYGARATSDWTSWRDVTAETRVVSGQRHGSILPITRAELRVLAPNFDRTPPPPVIPGVNADPHIAVFGDTFYLYPTTDGTDGWRATSFQAWSSRDLVNWKNEGVILDLPRDLTWATLHAWAPAIATKNGTYYYYYSAQQNIGVAVADQPAGPFKDPLGKPLVAKTDFQRMQAIDPMVFVDDDGSAYLYWGQGCCKAVKLNDDMISFNMADVRDLTPSGYNEGPFVHKRNGTYYLTWSEFDTRDPRYSVAYATGDSPLGPFTKAPDNPILRQSGPVKGAGHHSIVQIPNRDEWVIAYHRFRIPDGNGYNRETCLSPMRHAGDGRILPVDVFETAGTKGSASVAPQPAGLAPVATVSVDLSGPGRKISPDLFGTFFEDINYSADGGLYAELIQNRSFEYSPGDRKDWHSLTSWEWVERGGGKGSLAVETNHPLHANNPHHAVLTVGEGGGEVGLRNPGFDGIVLKAGELYDVSLFARQMEGVGRPLAVRLEGREGDVLGETTLPAPGSEWSKQSSVIRAARSANDARLVLAASATGRLALDMISLFPRKTFRNRPNGLRPDLAQVIADMKPRFVRFPGGCVAHGDGLDNIYRWKQTIGPVEQRKAQRNIWRYHQTMGLGYFEYFQFCEDIGAKPLPVVAAGVCCQNAGNYIPGDPKGQQGLPMAEMPDYVQEVLDLIEWANGPATSKWGALRAAAGHPNSFKLEYLGVGNEDHITPVFEERFAMLQKAIKSRHPEITLIGTSGPAAAGPDFDRGWQFARQSRLDMVDEHYYMQPEWFLDNLHRYDSYDRSGPNVYLGEYASRGSKLFNALAEAAYMASLERNGDVVRLSSYAPLLAKTGHTQWNPDLIYFDNTSIMLTANYHVQRLYGLNAGDTWLPNTVKLVQPSAEEETVGVFLGTWDTRAEFDDVRLVCGSAPLLADTFSQAAEGWQPEAGDWRVADGVYRQDSGSIPALARAISVRIPVKECGPNYTLSLRARKTGGNEGFLIGFGATDAANHYWWNLGGWGNRSHGIEKRRHGAMNPVGPRVPGRIETGRWYDIRVAVEGPRIRCYLDGTLIHDVRDQRSSARLVVSSVLDGLSGDIILKMVNVLPSEVRTRIDLQGLRSTLNPTATCTVLTGDPAAANSFGDPLRVSPKDSTVSVGPVFPYVAPPHSVSVIRLRSR
jgi:alpha-L-arabinofuranosidase/beta-xylosidase